METNKSLNDEVDLIDLLLVVWKKKWIIFFILIFGLILVLSHEFFLKKEREIFVKNEIKPLTVLDETKYKTYNSFIKTIKPFSLERSFLDKDFLERSFLDKENFDEANVTENIDFVIISKDEALLSSDISDLKINNINKEYLHKLFIDQISQKSKLIEYIKESKIIDVNDYENNSKYEKAAENLSRLIGLNVDNDQQSERSEKEINRAFLEYSTFDLNKWENFLKFLEKKINFEVQENLNLMFEKYIEYVNQILDYQIEDIDTQLSIVENKEEQLYLQKKKKVLESDRYISRITKIFKESPISNRNDFYAAKILINRDIYIYENNSIFKKILLTSIIFLVFGIFLVLISHALKNRREN